MEPVLVVVYSRGGVSRRLARTLCWQFGWPMGEVVELQPPGHRRGALRCLWDSLLRATPPVGYRGPAPGGFRTVVVICPLWGFRLASPMRTFLAQQAADLRRVALVTTSTDARVPADPIEEVLRLTGRPLLVSSAFASEDVRTGKFFTRLRKLGRVLATA